MMLNWKTLVGSNDPKRYVKGTELEVAFPEGFQHRFAIYSVRTLDRDGTCDARYRVRDASTVSDADVRSGKRPAVVIEVDTLDQIEEWLRVVA